MDVVIADQDLTPALRGALDRAVAEGGIVHVVPIQGGGYRLVAVDKKAVRDRLPRGSARLGTMQHLGLTLDD